MALSTAEPGPSGETTLVEAGKDLAGLVVRDTSGVPRAGVFRSHASSLVTSRADMSVDVAAFHAALVRSGRVGFINNDGTVVVPATAAPVSNSRIDVLYVKQNNSASPDSDANNTAVFGWQVGTPGAVPVKPTLSVAGALELATITIPSTATATNSGGVVITQTAPFTVASGGLLPFRTTTERDAWTAGVGQAIYLLDTETVQVRGTSGWDEFPPVDTGTIAALTGFTINAATALEKQGGRVGVVLDIVQNVGNFTSNTAIATVPSGYRPATTVSVACAFANATTGWLRINSSGEVRIFFTGTASNTVYANAVYRVA